MFLFLKVNVTNLLTAQLQTNGLETHPLHPAQIKIQSPPKLLSSPPVANKLSLAVRLPQLCKLHRKGTFIRNVIGYVANSMGEVLDRKHIDTPCSGWIFLGQGFPFVLA